MEHMKRFVATLALLLPPDERFQRNTPIPNASTGEAALTSRFAHPTGGNSLAGHPGPPGLESASSAWPSGPKSPASGYTVFRPALL